jgi:dienelactone hydrolase
MSRIDRRVLIGAAIVLAAVVQFAAAGIAWYGRGQAEAELEAERQRLSQLERQVAVMKPKLDTTVPNVSTGAMQGPVLLACADVAATMQVIQGLGDAAGVAFDNITAAQSNTAGKQSFSIMGHGLPQQVCSFVAAIEQSPRLLVIETGRCMPGGGDQLAFELGLATYHQGGGRCGVRAGDCLRRGRLDRPHRPGP